MRGDRESLLRTARLLAAQGDDEAAKQTYIAVLREAPTDPEALIELAVLAQASGHMSAARTAYAQAVRHHPGNAVAHTGLGNIVYDDGALPDARRHFEAALAVDPARHEAHQGLARVLTDLGESEAAGPHWRMGFEGHAVAPQRYRGTGPGVPLLLLVSARGGNIRTSVWIDDRRFAVTAIHADFFDPAAPLPAHAIIVNAIGDADLAALALERTSGIVARSDAPIINHPAAVRLTGREATARRLADVPGLVVPRVQMVRRGGSAPDMPFPLLLRAPGFHTGQYFERVEAPDGFRTAAAAMPGAEVLAIEYLDARGGDGMARKYRAMFIDGALYPLHLAISTDWKVHYFTAAMATNPAYREEERRFLADMPSVIGDKAMRALASVQAALGLEYAGIDFGLTPDGSVLLFEANAPMVILRPAPDPMWDYRRPAIQAALDAASGMLACRVAAHN